MDYNKYMLMREPENTHADPREAARSWGFLLVFDRLVVLSNGEFSHAKILRRMTRTNFEALRRYNNRLVRDRILHQIEFNKEPSFDHDDGRQVCIARSSFVLKRKTREEVFGQ